MVKTIVKKDPFLNWMPDKDNRRPGIELIVQEVHRDHPKLSLHDALSLAKQLWMDRNPLPTTKG